MLRSHISVSYIWYIVSHKSIIRLLTSLWRHFKWDRHQIWTQSRLGIQKDVCKVSLLYIFTLRRYLRRSKGGNFMPPAAGGWRGGPAAAGLTLRDTHFIDPVRDIICWKFQCDKLFGVTMTSIQTFSEVRSFDVTWWPDLEWPGSEIFTCAKKMYD